MVIENYKNVKVKKIMWQYKKIFFEGVFMSKLYRKYLYLKGKENIIYIFKIGIFYVLIDDYALFLSNILNLKCTKLNDYIYKCGFPTRYSDKYFEIINGLNVEYKVIDKEF